VVAIGPPGGPEGLEKIKGMVGQFVTMFSNLLETSTQQFQFNASLGNNFEEIMTLTEGGDSLFMSLFNSVRAYMEISLDQNLPDLVKDNAGEMMQ